MPFEFSERPGVVDHFRWIWNNLKNKFRNNNSSRFFYLGVFLVLYNLVRASILIKLKKKIRKCAEKVFADLFRQIVFVAVFDDLHDILRYSNVSNQILSASMALLIFSILFGVLTGPKKNHKYLALLKNIQLRVVAVAERN